MDKDNPSGYIGYSLVITSSFFYATYGIWTSLMGDFFGGFTASAIRAFAVLAILIPLALVTGGVASFEVRKNWKILVGMCVASSLVWGLFYYAVVNAGIGVSSSLNYIAIIIGMIFFGWLFSGERVTFDKVGSACLGSTGLVIVFLATASGGVEALALAFAVISGLAAGANTVLAKKLGYNTTQTAIVLWLISALANLPMIVLVDEPLPQIAVTREWGYLGLLVFTSVLSSWLLLRGMDYVDAGMAGAIGALEIVFGLTFGIILFGEQILPMAYVGITVIFAGVAFPYLYSSYRHIVGLTANTECSECCS